MRWHEAYRPTETLDKRIKSNIDTNEGTDYGCNI